MSEPSSPEPSWLSGFLNPRSVAVIGVSEAERSPGRRILVALRKYGFEGAILPIHPERDEVEGFECHPSLASLPTVPDVAVIVVPAQAVPAIVDECAAAGIRHVVVGSAGFAEAGPEGRLLQSRIEQTATAHSMMIVGPNTNGVIGSAAGFTANFTPALAQDSFDLTSGPVSIVAQSGALGATLFYLAQRDGLGVSALVNTGNEAVVGLEDTVLELVSHDEETRVVLGYVEGLREPTRLMTAAIEAERTSTTICVLKAGKTEVGAQAAAAHTANLAGSHRAYAGVLRQLGILEAGSVSHLVDVGRVAAAFGHRLGDRLSVASMSGGLGIMITDQAIAHGLRLPSSSDSLRSELAQLLPAYLGSSNPVDLGGAPFFDLDLMDSVLDRLQESGESDVLVLGVCGFEQRQTGISERLVAWQRHRGANLAVVWLGGTEAVALLNRSGVPAFLDAGPCIEALATVAHRRPCSLTAVPQHSGEPTVRGSEMPPDHPEELLRQFGLSQPRQARISGADQAEAAVTGMSWPVVAKISSSGLAHKSDVGGVVLGLTSLDEVISTTRELLERAHELGLDDAEVVLQEQVPAGVELLIGMHQDPTFGPLITLGLGGVQAEALDDVQVRLPDLTADDVADMLDGLRHSRLLSGFRGLPRVDAESVAPTVLAFAAFVRMYGHHFSAIDINPLVVSADREPTAVDTLFVPVTG